MCMSIKGRDNMQIKGLSKAISTYKYNSYEKNTKNVKVNDHNIRNKDVVEISSRRNDIDTLKTEINKSVSYSANAEKISTIKQKISSGSYYIPTEKIVESILG